MWMLIGSLRAALAASSIGTSKASRWTASRSRDVMQVSVIVILPSFL
jgi:hypothetical protein